MSSSAQQDINTWSGYYGVPSWIPTSIAQAESGLNPAALGDFNQQNQPTSFGLFQLHQGGGQGDGYTQSQLLNPALNAQIGIAPIATAYVQSQGMGLSGFPLLQYVADHSGHPDETGAMPATYEAQLAKSYTQVTGKKAPSISSKTSAAAGGVTPTGGGSGLGGTLTSLFWGVAGGAIVIAGLWVLFKST